MKFISSAYAQIITPSSRRLILRIGAVAIILLLIIGGGIALLARKANHADAASTALNRSGWTASASSIPRDSCCKGDVPANALDGKASTRWSTGVDQSANQWFQVDMKTTRSFNSITLDAGSSAGNYPRGYKVLTSNNKFRWGNAIASGHGTSQMVTISFAAQSARYIRVIQTDSASSWWSIQEFNVYTSSGTAPTNTPTKATATSTSTTATPTTTKAPPTSTSTSAGSFPTPPALTDSKLDPFLNAHVTMESSAGTPTDSTNRPYFKQYVQLMGGDAFISKILTKVPHFQIQVTSSYTGAAASSGDYTYYSLDFWKGSPDRRVPTLMHETVHHISNGEVVRNLWQTTSTTPSMQWDSYPMTNPAEYIACGVEWVIKNDAYSSTETKRARLQKMDPNFYNWLVGTFIPQTLYGSTAY
jgi:F5/8 type C domain